jgi:hypothetical protein
MGYHNCPDKQYLQWDKQTASILLTNDQRELRASFLNALLAHPQQQHTSQTWNATHGEKSLVAKESTEIMACGVKKRPSDTQDSKALIAGEVPVCSTTTVFNEQQSSQSIVPSDRYR